MSNQDEEVDLLIVDLSVHFLLVAFIVPSLLVLLIIVLVVIGGCQAQSGKCHQRKSGPDDHSGNGVQVCPEIEARLVNLQSSQAYLLHQAQQKALVALLA